jgi:predicted MPP superfamily phosphohydrolase
MYESHRKADIEEVEVPLAHLPDEFHGFRIVQFSDTHVGPTIKRKFVERIAEQISALRADLLVFTGDLVDGSVPWLRDDVAPLKDLSAPHGKYFITGNHEYYSGALPWINEVGRLGYDVLLNEHRIVARGSGKIVVAGVTDYSAGDFIAEQASSPSRALEHAPAGLVRILLAHQPRTVFEATRVGTDLQLSGHTHGGQFFPWNYLATLNQPFIKGLHKYEKTWVYVNRGAGYWGPQVRVGAPPEITVLKLVAAST